MRVYGLTRLSRLGIATSFLILMKLVSDNLAENAWFIMASIARVKYVDC